MEKYSSKLSEIDTVKVEYSNGTYISHPVSEADYIIAGMYEDKVGDIIKLEFKYENNLNHFFEALNDNKDFKHIPASLYKRPENKTLYGENIEGIECRALWPSKPIEIVRMKPAINEEGIETVIVYARRIKRTEMLKYMDSEIIRYNELTNDKYKLRKIKGYEEKLKEARESIKDTENQEIWEEVLGITQPEITQSTQEETDTKEYDFDEILEDGTRRWIDCDGQGLIDVMTGELVYTEDLDKVKRKKHTQPPTEE